MDNCWISCQVMADMRKVYEDLIIINMCNDCSRISSTVISIIGSSNQFLNYNFFNQSEKQSNISKSRSIKVVPIGQIIR